MARLLGRDVDAKPLAIEVRVAAEHKRLLPSNRQFAHDSGVYTTFQVFSDISEHLAAAANYCKISSEVVAHTHALGERDETVERDGESPQQVRITSTGRWLAVEASSVWAAREGWNRFMRNIQQEASRP